MRIHTYFIFLPLIPLIISCSESKKEKTPQIIPVRGIEIKPETKEEIYQYSGNIVPFEIIKFGFMVAGKVNSVDVVEGEYVKKGQLIASLEPRDYELALEAAEAQFNEASQEYKRLKKLYEKGSLTQSDYEKIKALYKEARADYEFKKKQLNETVVYAPGDGWIAVEGIEPGEIIPQGMPVFGLVHTKKVFAQAAIPENEINTFSLNMDVKVRIPSLNENIYHGTISRIGQVADPYARSFPVKVTLTNEDFQLKAGMIAFLLVPTGDVKEEISIPARSVIIDASGQTYVFIVSDTTVKKIRVSTGKTTGDQVEIIDGLAEGDFLVTEGTNKLYEGAEVKILN